MACKPNDKECFEFMQYWQKMIHAVYPFNTTLEHNEV